MPGASIGTRKAEMPRAGVGLAGAGEQDDGVALVGEADGRLFARQDVVIAVAARLHLQVGRIGAAARLGQAQADDCVARHQAAVPVARQLGVGVAVHDGAHQRPQQLQVADVEVAVGDFLGDQARGDTALAQAAVLFRKIHTDQAQRADLLHQRAVETLFCLTRLVMGFELFAREAASDVAQGDLVFVEQHVPDSLAV